MAAAPNTNILFPQSPFLDPLTGRPAREWMQWLLNPNYVGVNTSSIVPIIYGGTGTSSAPANGQLLIGNGGTYSLRTLTAGSGIAITNAAGAITVSTNATGVTAGTYGNASHAVTFTVNAQGQLTYATTMLISIAPSQITGGATGTFKSGDATPKVVTVSNGVIVSIV